MKRLKKIRDLQKKYWLRYIWWHLVDKKILLSIAKGWREYPIVHFPLIIDIEIGTMMYFYLLNGWNKTLVRCTTYNEIIVYGKQDDEDIDLQCLTEKARYKAELNKEMSDLVNEYY